MRPLTKQYISTIKVVFLLTFFLLSPPSLSYAQAKSDQGPPLQILQMDDTGMILELRLPKFALETKRYEGLTYQTLSAPDLVPMTEPGQPQLLGLGELLGTPPGGIDKITILEQERETLTDIQLVPTPTLTYPQPDEPPVETFILDEILYGQDAFFPGSLTEVGLTGRLRDQAVTQLRVYPFQYNPVQQTLEIYRRLRIQVHFVEPPVLVQSAIPSRFDTPYERVLQASLLNYATLPAPVLSQKAMTPSQIAPQSQGQALKIFVDNDGLYQVTYQDLQNAGFDLNGIDPRQLQLNNNDSEVAIYVSGKADGIFDPEDWLEFYGQSLPDNFTDRNIYWLRVGDQLGQRMVALDSTPTGAGATPTAFYRTLHLEENHEYWPQLPSGGDDHWFWSRFHTNTASRMFTFKLQNIASLAEEGLVRVALYGRTRVPAVNPDHHTQLVLNGHIIDEAWWDGDVPFTHEVSVPQSFFKNGDNTLVIKSPNDTGAKVDSFYLNIIDLEYWDNYTADNDELIFTASDPGLTTFSIDGFSHPLIWVYDISDPAQVGRLTGAEIEMVGGQAEVQMETTVRAESRYLALTADKKRSPAGFLLDTPSTWRSSHNQADYLIITHSDFSEAASRLADYRAGQGRQVAVIQVTDLYDEFSGGRFTPQAIRDFLGYAYHHWTPPAPLYVLLIGDATYDYHDYLGTSNVNFVPTHLFTSGLIGQTSSDNWFVSVSGDDPLPDMFIGRLAVRTLPQAHQVIDKIVAYEQNLPDDWQQKAVFVTDDGENGLFETESDQLISLLPPNYDVKQIYPSLYPRPHDPTPDILKAIDEGALIVNYIGHGSVNGWNHWQDQRILIDTDISSLNNGPRYPFLVTGNCYNGLFSHPESQDSLAESFVKAKEKGAIGAWSPTGLGYTFWHEATIKALYETIFADHNSQLGPATTTAKIEAYANLGWREPIEIFTLFGDPALALQVVQPRLTLNNIATASHIQPDQLLTYILTYSNNGNAPAKNVVLTQLLDDHTTYHSAVPPPSRGNNIWELGSLPANTSETIVVTVAVSKTVEAGMVLNSEVRLTGEGLGTETAIAQTIIGQPTLTLQGVVSAPTVKPGQLLTYILTYANHSDQPAKNVDITANYDANTNYHSASPAPTTDHHNWEIDVLPGGTLGTIMITVQVSGEATPSDRLLNQVTLKGIGLEPQIIILSALVDNYNTHLPVIFRD